MALTAPNRVALVTGSSTGLGKATAFALARMGARVAFNYKNNKKRAREAFSEFQDAGGVGILVQADVTKRAEVRDLVARIEKELGPIGILVCNATPAQPQERIEDYQWQHYLKMMDYFVKSPFLLTRACLPNMKRNQWGRIINIISEVFTLGVAPFSAYAAAKGGQVGFSRSMATELAPFGITVNMVSPGWIPVERHWNYSASMRNTYLESIPVGRWGHPDDVAAAVAYYASEEASFVTGQCVSVNGGRSFGI